MRVFLKAKVTETENCKGIWLNTITVQLLNKSVVVLDRDTTEYSVNGRNASIEFSNVYIWGSETETMNYDLNPNDFICARLIDWEIDDDVDEGYELRLIKNSIRFC